MEENENLNYCWLMSLLNIVGHLIDNAISTLVSHT